MSSEHEAAANEVLAGFVPIDPNHPRVRAFEDAVADAVAHRPSPEPDPVPDAGQLDRIESKLDQLIDILGGGAPS